MFAVIYKCSIYPEHEAEYRQAWRCIANYFVTHCGALGSCLHKTEQGEWIAYSRWPDQKTRDAAWITGTELPADIKTAIKTLKDCMIQPHEEICMTVVDDLLQT